MNSSASGPGGDGMLNAQHRRRLHDKGLDLFWNPLARRIILLLILLALILAAASGIDSGNCAMGTMLPSLC